MRIRMLGVAAGGGFPQWNCACPNCRGVREGTIQATPLLQSSLALSGDGRDWYLVNAGPDVRSQLESFSPLHPGPRVRQSPLRGVILTDAELDHTIGLLSLREGSSLTLFGTEAVRRSLQSTFPVLPMLQKYCSLDWRLLDPADAVALESVDDSRPEAAITIQIVPVSQKAPLYAESGSRPDLEIRTSGRLTVAGDKADQVANALREDWAVGLFIQDGRTGGSMAYFPALEEWTSRVEQTLSKADIVIVDGTFWSEQELVKMGVTERDARAMGHLPLSGEEGTAAKLSRLPAMRKILAHINNSNPILRADSPERQEIEALGIEVGYDGMELEV